MMQLKLLLALFAAISYVEAASIKWSSIYTGFPQNPEIVPYAKEIVNCTGPYALCSYAECKIVSLGSKTEPAIAECGCYGYPKPTGAGAVNIGAVPGMLSKAAVEANRKECSQGTAVQGTEACAVTNVAPACAAQARKPRPTLYKGLFDLISTFNPKTWPFNEPTKPGNFCPYGQYTNCYSAGCKLKTAWNGANTTCYCPVYNIKKSDKALFLVGAANSSCVGSKGFTIGSRVWNGLGLVQV